MKRSLRFLQELFLHFSRDLSTYFYKGWQARLMRHYLKAFARSLIFYLNQCRIYLYSHGIQQHHIREENIKKLQMTSQGLHNLLLQDARFSYSILIPVAQPQPAFFQETLESALNQSAPLLEILIGLMQPPSPEIMEILSHAQQCNAAKLQIFHFFQMSEKREVINQLAEKATGHFLLMMDAEDWIRPDFLLRCEQTLRIFPDFERRVLYCNLNALSDKGYFIPNSEYRQPSSLCFPFFFKCFVEKGLLIPTALWKKAGGLHAHCKGAEYENLLLQLDLADAAFQHIPLNLYSFRFTAKRNEVKSQKAFLEVLEKYSQARQLDWKWSPGYQEHSVRAIPSLSFDHSIQVIIPYKDQKSLTMKCIHHVLKQKDVHFKITAVDNRSTDASIAREIKALGGEVIAVDEPFNYSRLNNLAVKATQTAADCDVLLFLNNDVELEPNALSEMLRWIDQPQIGIVGCRLHYPDGRLQHGGIRINFYGKEEMRWEHIEKLRRFEDMNLTKTLGFFNAVTAACAMIKRQIFLEVGGFDEIWYPIGYSDTNLAAKIAAKGLKSFYTPYAIGIHYESVSRKSSIEDYENSWWLHHLLMDNQKIELFRNC
jgi:GT2 family glycosyltransferase